MAEHAGKPKVRFAGFTEAWEQRKVSDMFKVTRGYVLAAALTDDTKSDEIPYPVYSSQTKDSGLMGYYRDYLYEDAITWTTDGANAGTVNYRAGKFYCTNVCGVLLSDRINASQMVAEALNNVAKGYVSYVGNPKLMNNIMADIEIMIPVSSMEQKMISDYFATLDRLVALHQRKRGRLENIKKAMLEKMFPKNGADVPEIRFAGFTEAWEQRKFEKIAIRSSAMAVCSRSLPGVEYEDIISEQGILNKDIKTKRAVKIGIKFLPGDVLFGKLRPYLKNWLLPDFTGVAVGDFWVLQPSEIDSQYLYYLIQTPAFQEVSNQSTGTKMPRADWNLVANSMFFLPQNDDEQTCIGTFFRQLDRLITLHQRKVTLLQNIKKACLEKMFV